MSMRRSRSRRNNKQQHHKGCEQAAHHGTPSLLLIVLVGIALLSILGAALFVILSGRYEESAQKWAYGAVGAITTSVLAYAWRLTWTREETNSRH